MKALAFISMLTLIACSTKNGDENLNAQVIMLHNSMIKKANAIEHRLAELESDSLVNKDSVQTLLKMQEEWEADLVEVPGNNNHDHEAHHHHDHKLLDVTAEQMLAIQKELDERLSRIGKRTTQLKPYDKTIHQH
jgi:hypothetical protein